jgi:hypothetical protein
LICVFNISHTYNLYSKAYDKLCLAYKFILSLSSSHVTCKRNCSLKYILNSLINSLSQLNLEAFMLMSCKYDVLAIINNYDIINNLAIIIEHFLKKNFRFSLRL